MDENGRAHNFIINMIKERSVSSSSLNYILLIFFVRSLIN